MMYMQDGEHMQALVGNDEYDHEDDLATGFATYAEAEVVAETHPYASLLGYEIFSMEKGL